MSKYNERIYYLRKLSKFNTADISLLNLVTFLCPCSLSTSNNAFLISFINFSSSACPFYVDALSLALFPSHFT